MTPSDLRTGKTPHRLAFAALIFGNVVLAFGPWLVRLADVGPVAAGFWRLALAIPLLWLAARAARQPLAWPGTALGLALGLAALFFSLDIAAWHIGIRLTKLGNAALFANLSSFGFAAWGLWLVRRWPSPVQALALLLAAAGCALLMSGSYELSPKYLRGDLLSLLAGLLYVGYLIIVERARGALQPLPLLLLATIFGAAMLLPIALALGENIWPSDWGPLLALAIGSQVVGQGLLVYSIGTLPPLVVGFALLTQPAISALIGWLGYGERLTALDWLGAAGIALALALIRLPAGLRAGPGTPRLAGDA